MRRGFLLKLKRVLTSSWYSLVTTKEATLLAKRFLASEGNRLVLFWPQSMLLPREASILADWLRLCGLWFADSAAKALPSSEIPPSSFCLESHA